mmetsp:Transcript_1680/g.3152  ORF Transcript_1680/g.3152 Transcript_1680/m.3152 type:complete len:473 (-) Transcript_1680:150-1568(-)
MDVNLVLVFGVERNDSLSRLQGTVDIDVRVITERVDELDHGGLGGVSDRLPGNLLDGGSISLLTQVVEVDRDAVSLSILDKFVVFCGDELRLLVEDSNVTESGALAESLEGCAILVVGLSSLGEGGLAILDGESVLSTVDNLGDSHDVLSEGSGLVRADAGGGPKGLDSLEVLDEDHLGAHALGSEGKAHRHSGDETLGDVCDNDTNHEHKVLDELLLTDSVDNDESDTKSNRDTRDDVDEVLKLLVDGGLLTAGGHGKGSNASHDSVVTGGDDNSLTGSLRDLSSEEAKVLGLKGVFVGALLLTLLGLGLSSKGSVVDNKVVRALKDTKISRDEVSGVDLDDVSGDKLDTFLVRGLSVTEDEDLGRKHVSEGLHEVVRLLVLNEGEDSGTEHDEAQHESKVKVINLGTIKCEPDEAQNTSKPKKEREEISELLDELDTDVGLRGRGELVGTPLLLKVQHLRGGKTLIVVGA